MEMGWGFSRGIKGLVVLVLCCVLWFNAIVVYGAEGGGNDAHGDDRTCATFEYGYTALCGSEVDAAGNRGSDGGGASWHIFPIPKDDSDIIGLRQADRVSEGGYNNKYIKDECQSRDWVVVYGWEGSRSKKNYSQEGDYNVLTGPVHRNEKNSDESNNLIHVAAYNNYEASSLDNVRDMIARNAIKNQRLYQGVAKRLYYAETGETLSNDIGFFCFSGKNFETKYLVTSGIEKKDNVDGVEVEDVSDDANGLPETREGSIKKVNINTKVELVFYHNIFSSLMIKDETDWEIERSFPKDGYSLVGKDTNKINGSVSDFSLGYGSRTDYYPSKGRSDSYYVAKNVFEVKFTKAGEYTFCETFSISNTKISPAKAMTKVCAKFEVTDPQDPECSEWVVYTSYNKSDSESGYTDVLSGVKVGNDSTWTLSNGVWPWTDGDFGYTPRSGFEKREVYAKPGDTVYWQHCYYPGTQKTSVSNKLPRPQYRISIYEPSARSFVGAMIKGAQTNTLSQGNSKIQRVNDLFTITRGTNSKTGMTLQEGIAANGPSSVEVRGDDYLSNDSRTPIQDSAAVKIPYNFTNTATVKIGGTKDYLYAGESSIVEGTILVNKRQNDTINKAEYATKVDQAEARLIFYTSDNKQDGEGYTLTGYDSLTCNNLSGYNNVKCVTVDTLGSGLSATLNGAENSEGVSSDMIKDDYGVLDVPAGTYFCAVAAVYPYIPSGDTDVKSSNNGNTPWKVNKDSYDWYVSKPSCKVIAKKPTLQVWGGGIYTAGTIGLEVANKRLVAGLLDDSFGKTDTITFSSWVEQNVIANGPVNIASGASTGEAGVTERTYEKEAGGSYNQSGPTSICVLSPLTMPNDNCQSTTSALINPGVSDSMREPIDKETLVKRFAGADSKYTYENRNSVGGGSGYGSIAKGDSVVIHNKGDISIVGDIIYADGYNNITDIPKMIVYAENGNINIKCDVRRIDAVLIADKNIDTCSGGGDNNASARSRQLRINGAVIANKLFAGRTYGAGSGVVSRGGGSDVSAEIVNYDTSLYLWAAPRTGVGDSGKLKTVYQAELSPRY